MLDEFIQYLKEQVGEPYLWGGQHTKLTPENYIEAIKAKEKRTGKADWESDANNAIAYCRKKFDKGSTVLYAYDCSGLGCYWLYNLQHLFKCDLNANAMMGTCELKKEQPKKGWWVFRLSGKTATHIGYMIDDNYLIEAKGRSYGVTKTKFKAKSWNCWGIPEVFKSVLNPVSESDRVDIPPEEEKPILEPIKGFNAIVKVVGRSVNIRTTDSTKGKILFTAHNGNKFNLINIAESGWYHIETSKGDGYITNLEKYTRLIDFVSN